MVRCIDVVMCVSQSQLKKLFNLCIEENTMITAYMISISTINYTKSLAL